MINLRTCETSEQGLKQIESSFYTPFLFQS